MHVVSFAVGYEMIQATARASVVPRYLPLIKSVSPSRMHAAVQADHIAKVNKAITREFLLLLFYQRGLTNTDITWPIYQNKLFYSSVG